eukprot:NODE_4994_length_734_cov_4.897810_g4636_i0.p1 GENE.NODE_4994_length_734_cov_4.897810_g4636_i0~~NODE_4994_length_734_cov_4.897810_g4636_i0.p1  ORF type:complete len:177 (-),score=27.02 NODE_4994_length_734_cov_4.897810_g4636_i0:204-704(-)
MSTTSAAVPVAAEVASDQSAAKRRRVAKFDVRPLMGASGKVYDDAEVGAGIPPELRAKAADVSAASSADSTPEKPKAKHSVELPHSTTHNKGPNWSAAEFDDPTKKQKFLRLMGSKEAVPAAAQAEEGVPNKAVTEKMKSELEDQFEVSRSQMLSHRTGLGFGGGH